LQKIEETLVNGERNTIKLFNQHIQLQKEEFNNNSESNNNAYNKISNNFNFRKEKSIEMLPFLEKQSRSFYFNICNEFYSSLKFMCEDLKNYPKENDQRKNKLIEYINNFNENFEQQRIDNEDYLLNYPSFFGIILPFNDSSSAEDIDSSLIIRIIPEQCFCFSTKARVPTKICAECIQVKELNNSEYLNSKKTKNKYLKSKAKNNLLKTFTVLDDTNTNLNINKYVGNSFQRKKTTKVRQLSLLGNHNNIKCSSNNSLEYNRLSNKSQISEENEEEEKGEKLRKFLYNINKTIEEEGENIINEDALYSENDKINNGNEKESQNKIVDDFEILPEITEDLKNVFGKPMRIIKKEIQMNSPFKNFKTYKLVNFIAKANDDLRQELLAMQLIKFFDKIFKEEKIPLFLRTYEILITSSSSGLLEFLENTSSIDGIKKKMATSSKNLSIFYKKYFKEHLEDAQINFTRSLAAYSLVCYYLQIKDRHNGNILIDMNGNIIHIDFGFILGIAPGGINFEKAPFKLTREYVEIMGGKDSLYFQMYKDLMVKGMIACKKYVDNFISIAEIMSKGSKMPCFDNKSPTDIFQKFKERFYPDKKDEDFINIVNDLINWSYDNFRTNQYDNYQKLTNGILP
jgi:phosphatidylinositol 4-kinase